MNVYRGWLHHRAIVKVIGLFCGLAVTMAMVSSSSGKAGFRGTTGTVTKHQRDWYPGEYVIVKIHFTLASDYADYRKHNSVYIDYTDKDTKLNYHWQWSNDIASDPTALTVVSKFLTNTTPIKVTTPKKEAVPEAEDLKPVPIRGTGSGRVVYTDSKPAKQTIETSMDFYGI